MLLLIAEDFIDPTKIETVLPLYQELVEITRKEDGCISYELTHDLKEEGHFLFIEKWLDENALEEHTSSEHFNRLVPIIDKHIIKKAKYTRMNSVF